MSIYEQIEELASPIQPGMTPQPDKALDLLQSAIFSQNPLDIKGLKLKAQILSSIGNRDDAVIALHSAWKILESSPIRGASVIYMIGQLSDDSIEASKCFKECVDRLSLKIDISNKFIKNELTEDESINYTQFIEKLNKLDKEELTERMKYSWIDRLISSKCSLAESILTRYMEGAMEEEFKKNGDIVGLSQSTIDGEDDNNNDRVKHIQSFISSREDEILPLIESAFDLDRHNLESIVLLSSYFKIIGKYDESIVYCERVIEELNIARGILVKDEDSGELIHKEDTTEADNDEYLDFLLKQSPDTLLSACKNLADLGFFEDCQALCADVLALDETNIETWYVLGTAFLRSGEIEALKDVVEQVNEMFNHPSAPDSLKELLPMFDELLEEAENMPEGHVHTESCCH